MKKTFLTSGLIVSLAVSPAIADDTLYKDTNIGSSCTVNFLGSDSGDAVNSFLAQYTPNNYTVAAGEYLAQNGTSGTQCPANSYCAGGTYTFSETADSGITACPDGFTLSAAGASNENDCYHACTASDIVNGEKVATIKGGTVTKGGTNTCDATCTTGYTFKAASGGTNPLLDKENIEGIDFATKDYYGFETYQTGGKTASDYNLTNGSWDTTFSYGNITGKALCSTVYYTPIIDSLEDETDQDEAHYCYCQIDGFTPTNGSKQSLSGVWLYATSYDRDDPSDCGAHCPYYCAINLMKTYDFRLAMLGTVDTTSEPAACVANNITVTWDQANGQGSVTNTCTYDGDITLPTAPTKTGYTFSGWKLVTGSSNE